MKLYIRIFAVALASFLGLFGGIYFAFEKHYDGSSGIVSIDTLSPIDEDEDGEGKPKKPLEEMTLLERAVEDSNRINVIAYGLNSMLADTIMFVSFDPDAQELDILSIPRDTYYHIEGFDRMDQRKINAVYGMREEGGNEGMKKHFSNFLGVPIDHYVRIEMQAVEAIVDTLGGYDVYIPYRGGIYYSDPTDTPPLLINLPYGQQTLNGKDAMSYLRFRQTSDGRIREGDVQRIARQQHFVEQMITKSLNRGLTPVLNTIIENRFVRTDISLQETLLYSARAASMPPENINFYTLEGEAKMINRASVWIHDPAALEQLMYDLYGVTWEEVIEEDDAEASENEEANH